MGHHLRCVRHHRSVDGATCGVYGLQEALGWWERIGNAGTVQDFYVWIKGSWIFMDIAFM
jgi:hypothetical protein